MRHSLCDLPDNCLHKIFRHLCPLPDKFSVGACCWRFYRLVSDKRLWLVVSPSGKVPEAAPWGAGPVYTTLTAAVQASRPGDTIWLAPHVIHTAADVEVPWPLHLLGGGQHPSDTWLVAPQTSDCALAFTASAKVALLSINATLAPCVVHKRGSLTLQNCLLASDPQGLHHLVSPVLTLAVSTAALGGSSCSVAPAVAAVTTAAAAEAAVTMVAEDVSAVTAAAVDAADGSKDAAAAATTTAPVLKCSGSSSSALPSCRPPAGIGPGKLQVLECQLIGGSTAVRCGGTGQLRDVRAIYESHSQAPLFWLEVNSCDRPVAAVAAGPVAAVAAMQEQQRQAGGAFLPHYQQQHVSPAAAAAAEDVSRVSSGRADVGLLVQQRSKAWHMQRQQQVLSAQAAAAADADTTAIVAAAGSPGCPNMGLARIHAVLGGRSINPASLVAHISSKQQQQQQE